MEVLMVVNGLGSGADVMALGLVLFQVPHTALMCFREGRAYWKTTAPASNPVLLPAPEATLETG